MAKYKNDLESGTHTLKESLGPPCALAVGRPLPRTHSPYVNVFTPGSLVCPVHRNLLGTNSGQGSACSG